MIWLKPTADKAAEELLYDAPVYKTSARKVAIAAGVPVVPGLGRTVNALVGLQFTLGIVAFVTTILRKTTTIPVWELVPTSAHQANGALLLATSAALLFAVHRYESVESSTLPAATPTTT